MRNKKQSGDLPGLPLITRIEIAQQNLPLRIILLVLALVIAFVAFGHGFSAWLTIDPGWTEIKATSTGLSCSDDFVLTYNLGTGQMSASEENKAVSALYSQAAEKAYQLFYNDFASDELHNMHYINQHINEDITVEPALYEALSTIVKAQNRSIYLAPAYNEYNQLFVCQSDMEAIHYDPQRQSETRDYIARISRFANDPQMIDIQLLGDSKLRINVSPEYLRFIEENEIGFVLDLSWMMNAFIADFIAQQLIDNGYTNGYLCSYDGFTRNLCSSTQEFQLNVFHRDGKDILIPAVMRYTGGYSIVVLRDFPQNEEDRWHYYAFEDGRIASLMLDPADGTEKCAVSSMICYSQDLGCSDILLAMAPVYLSDTLDAQQVNALLQKQIYTVYPKDRAIYTNDASVSLTIFENSGFSKKPIE